MRSDGSAVPNIYNGSTSIFDPTGSTNALDTQWTSFDILFIATATDIRFGSTTNTGTRYVEFDDVVVSTNTYIRSGTVVTDGDMEASDVTAWSAQSSAVLTKQTTSPHAGSQVLRIARNGVSNPQAVEKIIVIGKTYRVTVYTRRDGSATMHVL